MAEEEEDGAYVGAGFGAADKVGGWYFNSFLASLFPEKASGSSSPSGEQILHEQLLESHSLSTASHIRCGKKSAGLLNLFFRPCGCPYR